MRCIILFISLISLCLRYGFGSLFVVVAGLGKKTLNTLSVSSGVTSYLFETNACMLFSTAYRAWFMYIAINTFWGSGFKEGIRETNKITIKEEFFFR
jgi:hypothetical protein